MTMNCVKMVWSADYGYGFVVKESSNWIIVHFAGYNTYVQYPTFEENGLVFVNPSYFF